MFAPCECRPTCLSTLLMNFNFVLCSFTWRIFAYGFCIVFMGVFVNLTVRKVHASPPLSTVRRLRICSTSCALYPFTTSSPFRPIVACSDDREAITGEPLTLLLPLIVGAEAVYRCISSAWCCSHLCI